MPYKTTPETCLQTFRHSQSGLSFHSRIVCRSSVHNEFNRVCLLLTLPRLCSTLLLRPARPGPPLPAIPISIPILTPIPIAIPILHNKLLFSWPRGGVDTLSFCHASCLPSWLVSALVLLHIDSALLCPLPHMSTCSCPVLSCPVLYCPWNVLARSAAAVFAPPAVNCLHILDTCLKLHFKGSSFENNCS